eukprot:9234476-Alexandrium_andersonii.AAC.1
MSASLVGSEMCIRDSLEAVCGVCRARESTRRAQRRLARRKPAILSRLGEAQRTVERESLDTSTRARR